METKELRGIGGALEERMRTTVESMLEMPDIEERRIAIAAVLKMMEIRGRLEAARYRGKVVETKPKKNGFSEGGIVRFETDVDQGE